MASIQVELNPFSVPTGVTLKQKPGLRQDGIRPNVELPLSQLSSEALEALCEEFRANVFAAAGKVSTTRYG